LRSVILASGAVQDVMLLPEAGDVADVVNS
jgi:hypothetical protein